MDAIHNLFNLAAVLAPTALSMQIPFLGHVALLAGTITSALILIKPKDAVIRNSTHANQDNAVMPMGIAVRKVKGGQFQDDNIVYFPTRQFIRDRKKRLTHIQE